MKTEDTNLILDFSSFLEDGSFSTPGSYEGPAKPELFQRGGTCPYCRIDTHQVADDKREERASPIDEHGVFRSAFQCLQCGWWQTYYYDWRHDSGLYWDEYGTRNAVLRIYDPTDSQTPVESLRRALVKHPHLIDSVSRKKTEELVGSVFAEHYSCEVRWVGKSHDGGIDLILVLGDRTTMVQVKHRDKGSKKWKAEPVSTIREFLGAVQLAEGSEAIFVTTAHHFSRPAQAAANQAVTLDLVSRYELVDCAEFLRMLNLVRSNLPDYWQSNLDFSVSGSRKGKVLGGAP